jgi:hypothetical protein
VVHREGVALDPGVELIPGDGHGHGRTGAGADREGGDARIGAVVSQVIDQDLPAPFLLGERRHEVPGSLRQHHVRECPRKRETLRPVGARLERDDDVHAFASRRLEPRRQTEREEALAQIVRALDHPRPRHAGRGIEVEHDAVGVFDIFGERVPGVDLQHVHLGERNEPLDIIDDEVLANFRLLLDMDATKHGGTPGMRMAHELPAFLARRWIPQHQRQRARPDVR